MNLGKRRAVKLARDSLTDASAAKKSVLIDRVITIRPRKTTVHTGANTTNSTVSIHSVRLRTSR